MKKIIATLMYMVFMPVVLFAQVTSGTLDGMVKTKDGQPIANASIAVTFIPTNQRVIARTRDDGRYAIANLRPGNPYMIVLSAIGYKRQTLNNITVQLGQKTTNVFIAEPLVIELNTIQVTSDAAAIARKEGVTTQVTHEKLEILPTLSRSLQDMTRLTPQGNGVSFAGSNYRYNNLTIDGATSNDAFGFSQSSGQSTATVPTGTPGGLSRTQPISLDAVEQVSVSIAPYDVKIGNFTGGSVNAVTRSGTNVTQGSLYSFGRIPQFVGTGLSGKIPSSFSEYQLGGRIGGALRTDKMFYFVNAELSRRTDPVLFAAGTNGTLLTQQIAQQVRDSLISYAVKSGVTGYDPGTIGAYNNPANSEKYFGRLDWNLGNSILTMRSNFVNASAGNLERGQSLNKLSSQDFTHFSKSSSTVAELKTQLGVASNSLLMGASIVSDHRTPYGNIFAPQIEIQDIQYGQINSGSDREGVVYKQKTSTLELTDNLTWTARNHTVVLGTHNELYNVQYTFVNGYAGRWQYPNLTAFFKNQPNRIRATYSTINNTMSSVLNTAGADFKVFAPSAYLQDEIALTEALKVSLGVRVDATNVDDVQQSTTFTNLTLTDNTKPYQRYTNDYKRSLLIAPRVGFIFDKQQVVVHGGIGMFQGRMPFAWFAYPFIQNGTTFANVDYRPTYNTTLTSIPMLVGPEKQPSINSTANYEINLINNQYVQPQMARGNFAVDIKLPLRTLLVLDGTYTKTIKDVIFTNEGLPTSAGTLGGVDTRPIYTATRLPATNNPYSAVYVLSNTDKGYRYNLTANLSTKFTDKIDMMTAYSYGQSKDVANGQRNSFQSNVEYNQLVKANVYPLTWSNFDVRHRIVSNMTMKIGHTSISAVYSGSSGTPFSYVYSGDLNGDGSSNNDLIFVPKTIQDITVIPSTRPTGQIDTRTAAQIWADLDKFISSDVYLNSRRGQYSERNGARTPWNHKVDMRVTHDIQNIQLTVDISNVGNMMNKDWGKTYFVPNLNNQNVYPIQYRSGRAVNGTPSFSFDPMKSTYQSDDLLSRWQMQVGMRVSFM